MLVISRRIGESFLIGDDIEATVVDITGEKVVLGLNAPKSVLITRMEPSKEIAQNNALAGASGNINMNGFSKLYKARFPTKRLSNDNQK